MQETQVLSLDQEDPLEKEMATHASILAWRIPWTEKPCGLEPMGRKLSDTAERVSSPPKGRFAFTFSWCRVSYQQGMLLNFIMRYGPWQWAQGLASNPCIWGWHWHWSSKPCSLLFSLDSSFSSLCMYLHVLLFCYCWKFPSVSVFFWPCLEAFENLVPQLGIKPVPPTVEIQCPNHWTAREFPLFLVRVQYIHRAYCYPTLMPSEYHIRASVHRSASSIPVSPLKCAAKSSHLIGPSNILVQTWSQQNSSGNQIGSTFSDHRLGSFIFIRSSAHSR